MIDAYFVFLGYYSPIRVDLLIKWTKDLMSNYEKEMGELIEGIRTRILNNDHVTSELKRKMLSERMVESVKEKVCTSNLVLSLDCGLSR